MSDEWVKFVLNENNERVLTRCTKEEADGAIFHHNTVYLKNHEDIWGRSPSREWPVTEFNPRPFQVVFDNTWPDPNRKWCYARPVIGWHWPADSQCDSTRDSFLAYAEACRRQQEASKPIYLRS